MNPPVSKNPDYDQGYRDGWHDKGVSQLVIDLSDIGSLTLDDVQYMSQLCKKFPQTCSKVLETLQ